MRAVYLFSDASIPHAGSVNLDGHPARLGDRAWLAWGAAAFRH